MAVDMGCRAAVDIRVCSLSADTSGNRRLHPEDAHLAARQVTSSCGCWTCGRQYRSLWSPGVTFTRPAVTLALSVGDTVGSANSAVFRDVERTRRENQLHCWMSSPSHPISILCNRKDSHWECLHCPCTSSRRPNFLMIGQAARRRERKTSRLWRESHFGPNSTGEN